MEIVIPRHVNEKNKNSQITEKEVHVVQPKKNNLHLTVGELIHNCQKEYQCKICNKRFHDKYILEDHESLHANIKKFKCISCGEQFLELNGFKSHLISHIDDNIKLLENQFLQECNGVSECNSNLWYAQ